MKVELVSTHSNPLLGRKEVQFRVLNSKVTPSRSQIRVQVAAALMAQLNQVYVREIKSKSGTQQTTGVVHVYDEPANALRIEPRHIIIRNKVKQQEPDKEVVAEKPTEEEEK